MRSSNRLKLFEFAILGKAFSPREQRNQLFLGRIFAQFGQLLQQEQQVTKGIQAIALGCLDHTETQSAGIGTLCGVAEQKILARHDERFHRAFGKIIGQFQAAVQKHGVQRLLLVERVGFGLAQRSAFCCLETVQKFPVTVQQWPEFFLPQRKAGLWRLVFPGLLQGEHLLNQMKRCLGSAFAVHKAFHPLASCVSPTAHMGHRIQTIVTRIAVGLGIAGEALQHLFGYPA